MQKNLLNAIGNEQIVACYAKLASRDAHDYVNLYILLRPLPALWYSDCGM